MRNLNRKGKIQRKQIREKERNWVGKKRLEVILTFYITVDDTMVLRSEVEAPVWSQVSYSASLIK